jgi:hypothetical protein
MSPHAGRIHITVFENTVREEIFRSKSDSKYAIYKQGLRDFHMSHCVLKEVNTYEASKAGPCALVEGEVRNTGWGIF